jgi:hypothetical protein
VGGEQLEFFLEWILARKIELKPKKKLVSRFQNPFMCMDMITQEQL